MNQLVGDLSAQDNLNQACSELPLLLPLCHHDDLLLVGPAPRDPDHRCIDEQVRRVGVVVSGLRAADSRPVSSLCLSSRAASLWAEPVWTTTLSACVTAATRFLLLRPRPLPSPLLRSISLEWSSLTSSLLKGTSAAGSPT